MRKYLLFISFLLISKGILAHPLHVSVINITISDEKIIMTLNTFVDDWETAYFHYYGKPINLQLKENYEGEWARRYLTNSIKIHLNESDTELKFNIDTISFDELSMKLEMHAEITNKANSLYIYNALLTDIYADQTNLLILSFQNKETGIKFDYKKRTETLKLK